MAQTRITSIQEPLDADPQLALNAVRLVARAHYFGAVPSSGLSGPLDLEMVRRVVAGFASHGVAASAALQLASAEEAGSLAHWLQLALEQSEHSPMPEGEWAPLLDTLGEDLLAEVLGLSASSVRRYASGERSTPEDVAATLHFLALLLADLSGAYNDYGIRRWFLRPRTALDGRAPRDLLGRGFDVEGQDAERLRTLVASLTSAGAA